LSPFSARDLLSKFDMKIIKFILLCSILPFIILWNSCSHHKPYYRSGINKQEIAPIDGDEILSRLIFLGDAGSPQKEEPVLVSLQEWSAQEHEKTIVIFLGDNVYPKGIPPQRGKKRDKAEWKLYQQIETVKNSKARGIFIPGNHDWKYGVEGLLAQQEIVNQELGLGSFLPEDGCPGPSFIDANGVRLIFLDTDHWVNSEISWENQCPHNTQDAVLKELEYLISSVQNREVVVFGHHPLDTYGPHGGFYDWKDHIFPFTDLANWAWLPLPIVGSLYPLVRWNVVRSNEDLVGSANREMIQKFSEVFSKNPPIFYASGHEHSLQVFDGTSATDYILVSGGGAKHELTAVGHKDNTEFAHLFTGFMVLDFLRNKKVLLRIVEPSEEGVVFTKWLR
jgi:hypothetical protein